MTLSGTVSQIMKMKVAVAIYVTGSDLEKSFVFKTIFEITSHVLSDSCVKIL